LSQGGGGSGGGGGIGALFFVLGALLIFAIGFDLFLIVPFFVFIFGMIAMMVSDRKRSSDSRPGPSADDEKARKENVA
jgi:uncharacterized membrane protein